MDTKIMISTVLSGILFIESIFFMIKIKVWFGILVMLFSVLFGATVALLILFEDKYILKKKEMKRLIVRFLFISAIVVTGIMSIIAIILHFYNQPPITTEEEIKQQENATIQAEKEKEYLAIREEIKRMQKPGSFLGFSLVFPDENKTDKQTERKEQEDATIQARIQEEIKQQEDATIQAERKQKAEALQKNIVAELAKRNEKQQRLKAKQDIIFETDENKTDKTIQSLEDLEDEKKEEMVPSSPASPQQNISENIEILEDSENIPAEINIQNIGQINIFYIAKPNEPYFINFLHICKLFMTNINTKIRIATWWKASTKTIKEDFYEFLLNFCTNVYSQQETTKTTTEQGGTLSETETPTYPQAPLQKSLTSIQTYWETEIFNIITQKPKESTPNTELNRQIFERCVVSTVLANTTIEVKTPDEIYQDPKLFYYIIHQIPNYNTIVSLVSTITIHSQHTIEKYMTDLVEKIITIKEKTAKNITATIEENDLKPLTNYFGANKSSNTLKKLLNKYLEFFFEFEQVQPQAPSNE